MPVRGWLPPEGPQNVHRVPYTYAEGQGAHRVDNKVIYGPEEVILTADEDAWETMEAQGLTEVPQEVAEEALAARQDDDSDRTAGDVIEEWQDAGGEPAESDAEGAEEAQEPEEMQEGTDGPAIPTDLREQHEAGDIPYRGEDTLTLQHLAQAYNITANQSAEDLLDALEDVRGS